MCILLAQILLANGHEVFVVDNFSNSTPRLFENLIKLSDLPIDLAEEIDIRDTIEVQKVFSTYKAGSGCAPCRF